MEGFLEHAGDLRTRLWRTAGSRFYASRRFALRDRLSTFSIVFMSVIAIAVGLVDQHDNGGYLKITATALTTIVSVFVLVISLMEGNGRHPQKSDRLHQSGVHLQALWGQLSETIVRCTSTQSEDWDSVHAIRAAYDRELEDCPFNHDPIDALRFQIDHRMSPEFCDPTGRPRIGRIQAFAIASRYVANASWLSAVSWIVVVGLVALAIDWSALISVGH